MPRRRTENKEQGSPVEDVSKNTGSKWIIPQQYISMCRSYHGLSTSRKWSQEEVDDLHGITFGDKPVGRRVCDEIEYNNMLAGYKNMYKYSWIRGNEIRKVLKWLFESPALLKKDLDGIDYDKRGEWFVDIMNDLEHKLLEITKEGEAHKQRQQTFVVKEGDFRNVFTWHRHKFTGLRVGLRDYGMRNTTRHTRASLNRFIMEIGLY